MSDNDEFKESCKDIIQHLHPINIDELKKYFKERKIITKQNQEFIFKIEMHL